MDYSLTVMVYFVNVSAKRILCEFHQIQSSFGDAGKGNLHNEHVILVM
jgi:hypothetical protein